MKIKKIIAVALGITIPVGGTVFGVNAYKSYQYSKLEAEVRPVSYISWGYWGDTETSYGMVTNDSSQEIYLSDSRSVKKVYVAEGDMVVVGDPLIEYDTSELNIEIERKKLDLSILNNDIAIAQHALEQYKTATPVVKDPPQVDENILKDLERQDALNRRPEKDEKDDRIYNYITEASIPYGAKFDAAGQMISPTGTAEDPYVYYCNVNTYILGSFFDSILPLEEGDEGKHVRFVVSSRNADGTMMMEQGENVPVENTQFPSKDYSGINLPKHYGIENAWLIFNEEPYVVSRAEQYLQLIYDAAAKWEEPEGYTAEEISTNIDRREREIKALDIQRRQMELQLESMQKTAKDGMVYATVDGVVKTAGNPEEYVNDGTAFLVVTGEEGLYVRGTISELLLGEIEVGTVVTANSWESGMSFEATITEIDDYPTTGNSWGEGNPNVSYYSYTAYIEDSSMLRNGEYLDLSISTNQTGTGGLFIEKAYVRKEDGKSYVMIADENNQLKKQFVATGRTIYGSAVEIKAGLTEEDRIAFPYGKNAVEGVAVKDVDNMYY